MAKNGILKNKDDDTLYPTTTGSRVVLSNGNNVETELANRVLSQYTPNNYQTSVIRSGIGEVAMGVIDTSSGRRSVSINAASDADNNYYVNLYASYRPTGGTTTSTTLKVGINGAYINNVKIPTKISFSRYMRWETSNQAQSGTVTCNFGSVFAGTAGNLADNEFISCVTVHTHGAAYDNRALAFMTSLSITSSSMTVGWYRDSNDNTNLIRIFAMVCKYE